MSITRTDGASGAYFEVSATGVLTISDVVAAVAAGKGAIVGPNGSGWGHILRA